MFERWKRKPKVQVSKPDVIPKHIMPNHKHIIALGYSESKQYIEAFLKDLSRTELMDFQDGKQFTGTAVEEAAWESGNEAEWKRQYPIGKYGYEERIPSIVKDTICSFDIKKLEERVNGMQKKLDKITTLISNAEFKLCGKDALKL